MSRILIMGAAGRDFHNFNTVFRDDPQHQVKAFTAAQIPGIAGRVYPPELAGPFYPEGIPIYPEAELSTWISRLEIQEVVFAYSDLPHVEVMHRACQVLAAGASFRLLGPELTCLPAAVPVVAVCASRTGAGKSQTSRRVVQILTRAGYRVAVVRHPMPYGDLAAQAVQRFADDEDLERHGCTLEEREEYAPHLEQGSLVFAGVDYAAILARAESEAQVIVWDGGNNDFPFFKPDLTITVVDPLRPGHELSYFPGEVNLRAADLVILNKVDSASPEAVEQVRRNVLSVNPGCPIALAESRIQVDHPEAIAGKRVLVVEDGPTLTHGEMPFGSGLLAARRYGAGEVIDPRPFARGSLARVYQEWPQLGPVLPAMGYSPAQRAELAATLADSPAEVVVVGTPIDLGRVLALDRPTVRVRYELAENGSLLEETVLAALLRPEPA